MEEQQPWPAQWLRGVLELAVLGNRRRRPDLRVRDRPASGASGTRRDQGWHVYPILNRLEQDGAVTSSWREATAARGVILRTATTGQGATGRRGQPLDRVRRTFGGVAEGCRVSGLANYLTTFASCARALGCPRSGSAMSSPRSNPTSPSRAKIRMMLRAAPGLTPRPLLSRTLPR